MRERANHYSYRAELHLVNLGTVYLNRVVKFYIFIRKRCRDPPPQMKQEMVQRIRQVVTSVIYWCLHQSVISF